MTDSVTTTTTTPTPVPAENTFGKAFKNVLLFPFRAVKFLLKWGFRAVLAILIIFTLLYAINAALPMDVPEAQGMTTAQLYADRFKVMVLDNKDGQPLYLLWSLAIFPPGYFMGPFETVLCTYFPDGKFENWVRKTVITGKEYYRFVPSFEATLPNLPKIVKESFDRYTWSQWVTSAKMYAYPQLPTTK
ncbi:MAG: hypothetical protein KKC20_24910 [Proteobacteria bacterium]|nr:hypothetical protein [Pseudomonadota bacterium]